MKKLINFLFFRWGKWEIYEENKQYFKKEVNNITGWESASTKVLVDIYVRENKYTGLKQYKKVIKN